MFINRLLKFFREMKPLSAIKALGFKKGPVFIVGCGRSGTTLLLGILGAHPDIFAIPYETKTYLKRKRYRSNFLNRYVFRFWFFAHLIKQDIPKGKKMWCEKTPRHINHIPDILNDFGRKAKIIHIIRDGRDVVLSKHPVYGADYIKPERWIEDVKKGLFYYKHPQVLSMRYEDLVTDPKKECNEIFDFLGLENCINVMDFVGMTNVKEHNALPAPMEAIHERGIGKWKYQKSGNLKRLLEIPETERLLAFLEYQKTEENNDEQ